MDPDGVPEIIPPHFSQEFPRCERFSTPPDGGRRARKHAESALRREPTIS